MNMATAVPTALKDDQELTLILGSKRFKSAIIRVRAKYAISKANTKNLFQKYHPANGVERPRYRAAWTSYWTRVRPNDLNTIRATINLPRRWNDALRYFIYFDEWRIGAPLRGCSVRLIWGTPQFILKTFDFTTPSEPRLFIEIFKDSGIKDIEKRWPYIREQQKLLGGRKRFRIKNNFGRDRTLLLKRARGKRAAQIDAEMEKFPIGNTDVLPEAYRQAISRHKKRIA